MLWFCCSQLVIFSYKIFKLRNKNKQIRNLKLENWCIVFMCLNLCVVLNFDCIWLKYQRSIPTEIKTTLKLSRQMFIQPRLRSVANPWSLVLPLQLTDTLFVGLDICILQILRVCFYPKFNWQNTARLLCEIVHIFICSLPSYIIRLQSRVLGK